MLTVLVDYRIRAEIVFMLGKKIETLSWPEAEIALSSAKVVVIPLGARTKEHGHHLQLNNDWILAEYFNDRILERCNVVSMPTVQYGYFPAFVEYPGSVCLGKTTARDIIIDICKSINSQIPGRKFYVLNMGISTNYPLEAAKEDLGKLGIVMEYSDLLHVAKDEIRKHETQEWGTHADEIETSMMLYIAPETVRMEKAVKDMSPDKPTRVRFTRDASNQELLFSPTGVWGDPTLATVEKGKAVAEAMVECFIQQIQALESESFVPTPKNELYLARFNS